MYTEPYGAPRQKRGNALPCRSILMLSWFGGLRKRRPAGCCKRKQTQEYRDIRGQAMASASSGTPVALL
jgi:hypothetical protein